MAHRNPRFSFSSRGNLLSRPGGLNPDSTQSKRGVRLMNFLQILILGLVQGAAELLPVSSSAHVIVAEKLMGIDPSSPEATFLLVMLHTGTMFAVIAYFWNSWRKHYFAETKTLGAVAVNVISATALTGVIGLGLQKVIEKVFLRGQPPRGDRANLQQHVADRRRAPGCGCADLRFRTVGGKEAGRGRHGPGEIAHHRRGAGLLPAVPRLLAVRRDDFHRAAARNRAAPDRGIQLRAGGRADAGRGGGGSSCACSRRTRSSSKTASWCTCSRRGQPGWCARSSQVSPRSNSCRACWRRAGGSSSAIIVWWPGSSSSAWPMRGGRA